MSAFMRRMILDLEARMDEISEVLGKRIEINKASTEANFQFITRILTYLRKIRSIEKWERRVFK